MRWNHDLEWSVPQPRPFASSRLTKLTLGLVSAVAAWAMSVLVIS